MSDDATTTASRAKGKVAGMDRRTFCIGAGGAAVMLGMGTLGLSRPRSMVRPPGAQDEGRLYATCVRCEKCLTVCPRDVIAPAHMEDGFIGMRTPRLTFELTYCDWCEQANGGKPLCEQVCPTGALLLPEGARRDELVMGLAEIDEEACLGWRLAGCKFCYDACEFDAIVLDEFERPVVVEDKCVGCGACESVCVSLQNGSIREGATERAIVVRPPGRKEGA